MKTFELPHIGSRNIKTALSVLVCLIFWPNSLFAAIAAVICVQDTVENSLHTGINRLIGTLLGGIFGVVFIYITNGLHLQKVLPLVVAIGVSLIIYICNLIKKPSACSMSSITLMGILVAPVYANPLLYSLQRTIETAFGVIVAILINKYIHPPKENNTIDETN
ncbi:FUSC family protein [Clostridium nigeriense]|uniref:FUSC family protein n=1 Tax=Clostridium nigeriense TaxID=1805470 RepID=UPI00082A47A5|nr:aromatic acid exporter family protein [Clostridium nigeriense]